MAHVYSHGLIYIPKKATSCIVCHDLNVTDSECQTLCFLCAALVRPSQILASDVNRNKLRSMRVSMHTSQHCAMYGEMVADIWLKQLMLIAVAVWVTVGFTLSHDTIFVFLC